MIEVTALCPICLSVKTFAAPDDFASCRAHLSSPNCPKIGCNTRQRAVAKTIRKFYSDVDLGNMSVHQAAPSERALTLFLRETVGNYIESGYFPDHDFGRNIGRLRNEDLEAQTFDDETFDLVIHLDVLEHVYQPFQLLREIERTLKSDGRCIFTAPTNRNRVMSEQVAFIKEDGEIETIGEPEYHGNPQDVVGGSLVTWRYGYDLPLLISRETGFDIEVLRWQSRSDAIMGPMTEVYILTKASIT